MLFLRDLRGLEDLGGLPAKTDVSVNVPVNVPVNKRQQWFLNQLGSGIDVEAAVLAHHWDVTEKTARRDIAALKKQGIVEFVGSPITGTYRLKDQEDSP